MNALAHMQARAQGLGPADRNALMVEAIKSEIRAMPASTQADLADFIATQLSWSSGSDRIAEGVENIRQDLRDEDIALHGAEVER